MGQKKIMFFLLFKNKCKHIEIYIEYRTFFLQYRDIIFLNIYIAQPYLQMRTMEAIKINKRAMICKSYDQSQLA